MKKFITVLLLTLSIILVLSSCNKDGSTELENKDTPVSTVASTPTANPTPTAEPTPEHLPISDYYQIEFTGPHFTYFRTNFSNWEYVEEYYFVRIRSQSCR